MANYEGYGRTNHVLLKDEKAYDDFKACVALLRGTTEETTENGRRLIAAFGHEEDGDFRSSVTVHEIVESGYVSRHAGSLLDATRLEYLALVADPELNADEDRDADDGCDVLHELYPLLARGQVLTLKKVGHEKLRYVCGSAEAINDQGQRVSLSLDDIEEVAARAFVRPGAEQHSRDNQHPYFDAATWEAEVRAGDTLRGYGDWVQAQIEQTEEELARAEEAFEANGGRGVEAAEEIDELRKRLGVDEPGE